ncbi:nitronate monooxygenase [Bradyrhizobium sp. AUGA SZCCT0177]|uniref:NAD(P)H-dependent flavin oxidoreductase n=1 Tax=Bradyrhizobium sp. AUGA SZCCT0177 TaxID=2807665 RepID=UPI001BAACE30|nr:nitronate monooxygenase [Bradyrhizobium sp. AUGA SZCCT0177]MBR1281265.1 nitronate monooxygenase [Bradyrhizobium sp. AUGA SZCCT0177]
MSIQTRLTEFFAIEHPIILAPMTPAAGAELAEAVAEAGALGLLGGGYAEREQFTRESAKVRRKDIGAGFITWALAKDPGLLDVALEQHPRAMMLSFADPAPFARRIKDAGVPLICQVHNLDQALRAAEVGADVVVAQGTEAGGHGMIARSTMPFVPTVVDALASRAPKVMVAAAGGISDGRGLAAALMLGADGVLMGSRFWATQEALIHPKAKAKVVAASGDETVRTSVYDIVRRREWPSGYTGRLLRNEFIEKWHGREAELEAMKNEELARVETAWEAGDYDTANVTVGESIGLIQDIPRAGELVKRIAAEAEFALSRYSPGSLVVAA